MRTLKFIVDGQIIKKDPDCDFSGIVPGTSGYLLAEFSFSPEWKNLIKIASFYSIKGENYDNVLLIRGKSCLIPAEALSKRKFDVKVIGVGDKKELVLTTNKLEIEQDGR